MDSYTPEQREALNLLLHNYIKATQPGMLPLVDGLIAVDAAVRNLSLFNVALCESEGPGFSCTEIEEYADIFRALGDEQWANEIIATHAQGDDDEDDMPSHKAAAEEYRGRWAS